MQYLARWWHLNLLAESCWSSWTKAGVQGWHWCSRRGRHGCDSKLLCERTGAIRLILLTKEASSGRHTPYGQGGAGCEQWLDFQSSSNNVGESLCWRGGDTAAGLLPACWFPAKPTNKALSWKGFFFFFFPSHFQSVSFLLDVLCLICFFSVFQTFLKHYTSVDVVKCFVLFFIFILQTSLIFFFSPLWNS